MTREDFTRAPPFGMNGLVGLESNRYYWCRNPDGTTFVAKLENECWWTCGVNYAINVTREQVIYCIPQPEN